MASATPSPLTSSVEKTNGAKLSRLLIDGGTTVLRCIFDSCHPPASLSASFTANYSTLNTLLRKRILHRSQWDLLFPPSGAPPDSQTFDITLLFLLLTNICGLSPPHSGWHNKPPPSDNSLEANLARIKFYRNELYGHVTTTGIADPTFSTLWQEISVVLVALGLRQAEIDRLKAEHCGEQEFLDALLEWADSEEDIKSQLKEIRRVQTKVYKIVSDVHKTQLQDHEAVQKNNSRLEYIRQTQLEDHRTLQDSKAKLDEARRTQLEDSNTIQDTQLKVDEVYERLKTLKKEFQQNIDDLKGERKKQCDDEILRRLAKVDTLHDVRHHANRYLNGTRLSIFAEVESWLGDKECSNRVMVISGNAGMGKSVISAVLCEKMLKAGRLLGSHFCKHNMERRRNPKVMLQSLACQLSDSLPEYKAALVDKLSRNVGNEINSMEVRDLFELLFEEPLCGLNDPDLTYLMVMDGLDESECQGRNDLLDVIANYFKKLPLWIRFLITTRPELNIAGRLKCLQPLHLEPSNEENLSDIHHCFEKKLTHLSQYGNREILLKELVAKSEGIMLYAHYLVDFLNNNVPMTHELMQSTMPVGISSVYQCYFERLEKDLREQLKITEDQFLNFLCAVAAAREPLPLGFVSKLLLSAGSSSSANQRKLRKAITCISNLLPIENECIHFFHKSIKDWLIDSSCYGHHNFTLVKTECHNILAQLCIDELDELKRKGVRSAHFSDTAKYALQHGVTHMFELSEDARECSLEEVVTKYVLDLELVYAKLCVNSSAASEDIVRVLKRQRFINRDSFDKCHRMKELKSLLLQLRKHNSMLTEFPQALFQILLNDGGRTLSYEALNLLETKFPEFSYMEYLHKNDQEELVQARFQCSTEVTCLDVSPQLDLMVCQCKDDTIHLWSLETGKLLWTRSQPVQEPLDYVYLSNAFRSISPEASGCLSFYRSVLFHPTEQLVLAGILSYAYSFDGILKPLFPSSKCSFSVCSVSSGRTAILTDCPGNPKCVIMWSLIDGSETSRFIGTDDVLSFAWSRDGNLLAISDSMGCISLVDTLNGFNLLVKTHTSHKRGMIKFSQDCRYLFGAHFSVQPYLKHHLLCLEVKVNDTGTMSLDIVPDKISYDPWEYESCAESGFALGDSMWYPFEKCPADWFTEFALVLNEQCLLRGSPVSDVIEMLSIEERTKYRYAVSQTAMEKVVFSVDGNTLYTVTHPTGKTRTLLAWDVLNLTLKAEKSVHAGFGDNCTLVVVRKGVLLTASDGVLELWNAELSECVQRWTNVGFIRRAFHVTEERVALEKLSGKIESILDTTEEDIAPMTCGGKGKFVACNSKGQVVRLADKNSLQLLCGDCVLWQTSSPCALFFFHYHGTFSPSERLFVILGRAIRGYKFDGAVFVFDAVSGKAVRMLPAYDNRSYPRVECAFLSDEEYLISTNYTLRMFNIKSGQLLSVIAMESIVWSVTTSPPRRLVAVGLEGSSRGFKIMRVKPGEGLRKQFK